MSTPRPLTDRERTVLRLAAEGKSNPSIAKVLVLSPRTVEAHMSSAMDKLGAENRTQAVAIAMQEGLLGVAA